MPPRIDANQDYTRIRADVLDNASAANRGKGLRFEGGKGLYFRKSGNLLSNLIDRFTRKEKFQDAADKVKTSLNRQFGSVTLHENTDRQITINVGDFVFENLSNPNKLTAHDFTLIDSFVADLMTTMADERGDPSGKDALKHAASIFRGASQGRVASHHVNNWVKYVFGADRLRSALAADVQEAMQARGAGDRSKAAVDQIIKYMGQSLDSGLDLENINRLKAIMGLNGIATKNIDALVPTARIEMRYQAIAKDTEALHDSILATAASMGGANGIDPDVQNQLDTITHDFERGMNMLSQYLKCAGVDGREYLGAIESDLAKCYVSAKTLATHLERGSTQDRALAQKIREFTNQIYDLATSLNWQPGAALADQPSFHSFDQLNQQSPIYQHRLGAGLNTEQAAVSLPKTLYKNDAQSKDTLESRFGLDSATADYNEAVQFAREALVAFQNDPSDGNLKTLLAAVDGANMRSDDLMLALNRASSRRAGAKALTGDKDGGDSNARHLIGDFKHRLKTQRKELQHLKNLIGHVNHQRNSPVDLPKSGTVNNKWRAIRLEQAKMRQTYANAWMSPALGAGKNVASKQPDPIDENKVAADLPDEDDDDDIYGPGDESDAQITDEQI